MTYLNIVVQLECLLRRVHTDGRVGGVERSDRSDQVEAPRECGDRRPGFSVDPKISREPVNSLCFTQSLTQWQAILSSFRTKREKGQIDQGHRVDLAGEVVQGVGAANEVEAAGGDAAGGVEVVLGADGARTDMKSGMKMCRLPSLMSGMEIST